MGSLESRLQSQKSDRVVHRFKVPKSIPGEIREIGMVEITADEELQVEARCKGANDKRAHEMAKAAIVEINGQIVTLSDGSTDKAWASMSPKIRTLVSTAWVKLHLANDDEVESFFASRTSSV